ncbi:NAD(P)/FAD-dependent oxidoreductase [Mycobacteroides abscessus subsp. bolletii]|uniref:flavin-containing monooxygenase n=1 Tax=Mycobacteroides abscessus TaxID=36809 RepID=UPI0019CF8530|nr:NAD(P)/FAD-dependent oxidoreductase [Mycobacteroides abscessus]MBN7303122.1 NAD(P)/FAD-dependent oxidoreductase [Mycobacteroides abscessus subsp. bolletii]
MPEFEAVVIGAGVGGIAAGCQLQRAGIDNFVILERREDFSGTWIANTYPGVALDVPSTSYEFTFSPNYNWSRPFAGGAEVREYLQRIAREHGLYERARFGVSVEREVWNDESGYWTIYLADGEAITSRYVLNATGFFLDPRSSSGIPDVDKYTGKVMLSAGWDHSYDYRDKRVAVIGTGASSMQIVPSIAADVAHLDVYQRTSTWCGPKPDWSFGVIGRWLMRSPRFHTLAYLANWYLFQAIVVLAESVSKRTAITVVTRFESLLRAIYRLYLRFEVKDPQTRRALVPRHGLMANMPTFGRGFLRTFNRDNGALITTPIERFTAAGIRTQDGTERAYDMIVLATGFHVASDPESFAVGSVIGRDGFDLGEFYRANGMQAYAGVTLPGMPNRWFMYGPYGWNGVTWVSMMEKAALHAARVIVATRAQGAHVAEVTQDAHNAWHKMMAESPATLIAQEYLVEHQFKRHNVRSYFFNDRGEAPILRPSRGFRDSLWDHSDRFEPAADYSFRKVTHTPSIGPAANGNGKAATAATPAKVAAAE